MKYSSLNPVAWMFKPAPTQAEIILHDLKEKKRQLVDHELGKIKLQHERACLQEQFQYLQMSSEEKTSSEEDQA